ncbi:ketosynthase [Arhodomonas sp. AD133]|uniref:ketosynthase n=1 Tax=Arhodomonas sp. AD133 TaxID=3415009 RepID=UPI003EBE957C
MRGVLAAAMVLAYPAWSHAVVSAGYPQLSLVGLVAVFGLSERVRQAGWPGGAGFWAVMLGLSAAAALDLAVAVPLALYLPPVLIPLGLAWLFARSLMPGRRPLIQAFVQDVMGDRRPSKATYARRLTTVWALVLGLLAIEALALALFAPPSLWSLMTNGVNYAIVAGVFALEFAWRCHRFGVPDRPGTLWTRMLSTDWRRLGDGS